MDPVLERIRDQQDLLFFEQQPCTLFQFSHEICELFIKELLKMWFVVSFSALLAWPIYTLSLEGLRSLKCPFLLLKENYYKMFLLMWKITVLAGKRQPPLEYRYILHSVWQMESTSPPASSFVLCLTSFLLFEPNPLQPRLVCPYTSSSSPYSNVCNHSSDLFIFFPFICQSQIWLILC